MSNLYGELAEYGLFDSINRFLANDPICKGALKVKNDCIDIPKLEKEYITYIRTKRLGVLHDIPDNGSILIVHDSSAFAEISAELFQAVVFRRKGIYIKEQSLNVYQDTDRFIVGYHFPHWLTFRHLDPTFNDRRPIDVMYAGKRRKQRDDIYNGICKSSKRLGLRTCLTQSKKQVDRTGNPPDGMLTPKDYVKKMRQSKMCYSLMGTGYRSHRDWEALLCGAFMLNDDRSMRTCQFRGLEVGKHFVVIDQNDIQGQLEYWLEHEDERLEIARNGFKAAWDIWGSSVDQWHPVRRLACNLISKHEW